MVNTTQYNTVTELGQYIKYYEPTIMCTVFIKLHVTTTKQQTFKGQQCSLTVAITHHRGAVIPTLTAFTVSAFSVPTTG